MSGHSKWSTIKRKKGAADARRGAVFTRLGKEIAIAARDGSDPDSNFKLRLAVDRARAANMPKDNIERAIRRGAGEDKDGAAYEEIMYEGYGPHGVALLFEVVTDNRNRSLSEIRRLMTRANGTMAEAGAVSWQFTRKGYCAVLSEDMDKVFEAAVEAGADDVIEGADGAIEVVTPVEAFHKVTERLREAGLDLQDAALRMEPNLRIQLPTEEAVQVLKLVEHLEELDDMQNVYTNLEFTDEALALLEAA
ncbi:MAG: YebC/PmpR family DNA-binding transcriptional regulator [Chloroflexi bacterium]|nr:YebC/PmpR family DNA-binding transcriptional regulator [Chloroflexota bacterium]